MTDILSAASSKRLSFPSNRASLTPLSSMKYLTKLMMPSIPLSPQRTISSMSSLPPHPKASFKNKLRVSSHRSLPFLVVPVSKCGSWLNTASLSCDEAIGTLSGRFFMIFRILFNNLLSLGPETAADGNEMNAHSPGTGKLRIKGIGCTVNAINAGLGHRNPSKVPFLSLFFSHCFFAIVFWQFWEFQCVLCMFWMPAVPTLIFLWQSGHSACPFASIWDISSF